MKLFQSHEMSSSTGRSVIDGRSGTPLIRASHPLRTFGFKRGDLIDLVYLNQNEGPSFIEYKNSKFIKCYVRDCVDSAVFIYDGSQYVYPLAVLGILEVNVERLKK